MARVRYFVSPSELAHVLVRAQLRMNARMIETSFGKPSVRTRRRSLNQFARS